MEYPTPKELKKLADACRKAGILSFKCPAFEFTLSESLPKSTKGNSKLTNNDSGKPIESDMISEAELLFWSTGSMTGEAPASE